MTTNPCHFFLFDRFPKKRHLGPQNGSKSSRPEKLPKIVNCATIKEIERKNGGDPSGICGSPQISTWIIVCINRLY